MARSASFGLVRNIYCTLNESINFDGKKAGKHRQLTSLHARYTRVLLDEFRFKQVVIRIDFKRNSSGRSHEMTLFPSVFSWNCLFRILSLIPRFTNSDSSFRFRFRV